MTPPPPLFHALLRPAVLQILRAVGYHGAKTSVIDSVTDLAARYFFHLCELTARYATHNNDLILDDDEDGDDDSHGEDGLVTNGAADAPMPTPPTSNPATTTATTTAAPRPPVTAAAAATAPMMTVSPVPAPTLVDVRMALQRAGALLPERLEEEQAYLGVEDTRGVEAFIAWATGPLNREIARIALDGSGEGRDYLDALKKKHSKNDDDSKYLGTLLGRGTEHGSVLVEGGEWPSISVWEERRRAACQKTPEPRPLPQQQQQQQQGGDDGDNESRPPSSALSSLGDRSIAEEMDLS